MQHSSIRVVHPEQFDSATAQTPGSKRAAAIHPGAGIDSPMWGGLFVVEPGAHTGIHHHGEQHTIAYVLNGTSYIRWGDRGEFNVTVRAGDFLFVQHGFRTRRSIRRKTSLSSGSWSAALQNQLS